ncbi:MAG: DUF1552 domain-containing protein [Myxococcota bacterium]
MNRNDNNPPSRRSKRAPNRNRVVIGPSGRKHTSLSRRTMLRGVAGGSAVALALPALEAMLNTHGDAHADGTELPRRFVTWFFGNGVALNNFTNPGEGTRFAPAMTGPSYELTPQLQPLQNVRDYCSILSGFEINAAAEHRRGHHDGVAGFFSGYPFIELPPTGGPYASKFGGPSIDQVAANAIGSETFLPSVQLAISKRVITTEGPTLQYMSHQGPDEPLPQIFDPREAWDRLFGSFTVPDDPEKPTRLSVLDAVSEDVKRLQNRVGANDKMRLEAHLSSVAQLRSQIEAAPPVCTLPPEPGSGNDDVAGDEPMEEVNALMSDLLALAFSCDITRVASIQYTGSVSYAVFHMLGQSMGHHDMTHEGAQNENVDAATIFTIGQFAYLLEALMNADEGGQNLLDNSCLILSSDAASGLTHDVFDQPCIVAGGGGGALVHPGIHYASPNRENNSDILLSCLQTVCPEATSAGGGIGESTTPLSAIQA